MGIGIIGSLAGLCLIVFFIVWLIKERDIEAIIPIVIGIIIFSASLNTTINKYNSTVIKTYYKKPTIEKIDVENEYIVIYIKNHMPIIKKEIKWKNKKYLFVKYTVARDGTKKEKLIYKKK